MHDHTAPLDNVIADLGCGSHINKVWGHELYLMNIKRRVMKAQSKRGKETNI